MEDDFHMILAALPRRHGIKVASRLRLYIPHQSILLLAGGPHSDLQVASETPVYRTKANGCIVDR